MLGEKFGGKPEVPEEDMGVISQEKMPPFTQEKIDDIEAEVRGARPEDEPLSQEELEALNKEQTFAMDMVKDEAEVKSGRLKEFLKNPAAKRAIKIIRGIAIVTSLSAVTLVGGIGGGLVLRGIVEKMKEPQGSEVVKRPEIVSPEERESAYEKAIETRNLFYIKEALEKYAYPNNLTYEEFMQKMELQLLRSRVLEDRAYRLSHPHTVEVRRVVGK